MIDRGIMCLIQLWVVIAVTSYVVAAKVELKLVALQPDKSRNYKNVAREHTGIAHELARDQAEADGLLDKMNIRCFHLTFVVRRNSSSYQDKN